MNMEHRALTKLFLRIRQFIGGLPDDDSPKLFESLFLRVLAFGTGAGSEWSGIK
jgi:hypothetical protein